MSFQHFAFILTHWRWGLPNRGIAGPRGAAQRSDTRSPPSNRGTTSWRESRGCRERPVTSAPPQVTATTGKFKSQWGMGGIHRDDFTSTPRLGSFSLPARCHKPLQDICTSAKGKGAQEFIICPQPQLKTRKGSGILTHPGAHIQLE